jgi:hypothetical protein
MRAVSRGFGVTPVDQLTDLQFSVVAMISPKVPYASPQVFARYSPYGETAFLALPATGNPADIADNGSNPGPDGLIDNGDFSLVISQFFSANYTATCNP